jgi:hypothetical protein
LRSIAKEFALLIRGLDTSTTSTTLATLDKASKLNNVPGAMASFLVPLLSSGKCLFADASIFGKISSKNYNLFVNILKLMNIDIIAGLKDGDSEVISGVARCMNTQYFNGTIRQSKKKLSEMNAEQVLKLLINDCKMRFFSHDVDVLALTAKQIDGLRVPQLQQAFATVYQPKRKHYETTPEMKARLKLYVSSHTIDFSSNSSDSATFCRESFKRVGAMMKEQILKRRSYLARQGKSNGGRKKTFKTRKVTATTNIEIGTELMVRIMDDGVPTIYSTVVTA